MGIKIRARYEGKALRPLGDINLKEGEEVEIEVNKSPVEAFHGRMKVNKELADQIVDMGMWD